MKRFQTLKTILGVSVCTALSVSAFVGAHADERTNLIRNSKELWYLTPEQKTQVDKLLTAARQREKAYQVDIEKERELISKLFLKPNPDQKTILEIQTRQDFIKAMSDEDRLKMNLIVRRMLNPEQRKWLGIPTPSTVVAGIDLTPDQLKRYCELMRSFMDVSLAADKQRVSLNLDQAILLQEMDLVHGCHSTGLDEPALIANQKQLDTLANDVSSKGLQVAIESHNLLTDEQKKKLLSGAIIAPPGANFAGAKDENTSTYPPSSKTYKNVTLTQKQEEQYKTLMTQYIAGAAHMKSVRDGLLTEQRKLLSQPVLDTAALNKNLEQINQINEQRALAKLHLVAEVRNVLTPQQRHAVFNRHHPKIWYDTGINKEQDQKIMDIHMKIEAADREGRRKLNGIAKDMLKLFYEPTANDFEILKLQRMFDRAEADATKKQLGYLFDGRAILTEAQRVKLVQLMQTEAAH